MAATQDVYNTRQDVGAPGMGATSEPSTDITRTSETTANGGIAFGVPVAQGATEQGCIAATVVGDKLLGISKRDASLAPIKGDRYTKGSNVTVRTRGAIWVVVSVAVAPRDPVYFDVAAQKFTNVAGANLNLSALGWSFDTIAAANGYAVAVRR